MVTESYSLCNLALGSFPPQKFRDLSNQSYNCGSSGEILCRKISFFGGETSKSPTTALINYQV
uniref:Uncharacterized protein n=1 Tax=Lepeophtheirus salmonis TaxID=72036 RepID=A0A0K2TL22_LEPSM